MPDPTPDLIAAARAVLANVPVTGESVRACLVAVHAERLARAVLAAPDLIAELRAAAASLGERAGRLEALSNEVAARYGPLYLVAVLRREAGAVGELAGRVRRAAERLTTNRGSAT